MQLGSYDWLEDYQKQPKLDKLRLSPWQISMIANEIGMNAQAIGEGTHAMIATDQCPVVEVTLKIGAS